MTSCDHCSPCVQLVATTIFGQGERKFRVIFALGSEISSYRMGRGAARIMELSYQGTFVPGNESSLVRKFQLPAATPPSELHTSLAPVHTGISISWALPYHFMFPNSSNALTVC